MLKQKQNKSIYILLPFFIQFYIYFFVFLKIPVEKHGTHHSLSPETEGGLLAIDSGGNVSDLVLASNCCLARMLPGEAELVSE